MSGNRLIWKLENGIAWPQKLPADAPVNEPRRDPSVVAQYILTDDEMNMSLCELATLYPMVEDVL